jgi:hypothetical protein
MCRLCDGASWDEFLEENAMRLAVYGYFLMGVVDDDCEPWVYTVGLMDSAAHPELIVAGPEPEACAAVLTELAERVLAGERFAVGGKARAAGDPVSFGAVHPAQYENDTFNYWHEARAADVLDAPELEAVQVILGSSCFCEEHQHAQPILSNPAARVGERPPPPNRAARRRKPPRRRR